MQTGFVSTEHKYKSLQGTMGYTGSKIDEYSISSPLSYFNILILYSKQEGMSIKNT